MYTEKVMEHFTKPKNRGKPDHYDAVGEVGNLKCGDVMHIFIGVKDNKISDIGFETMGCAAAIATSSMVTELAKGKSIDEAEKITHQDVVESLEGLPPLKMHCSTLAIEGLKAAIKNYKEKMS